MTVLAKKVSRPPVVERSHDEASDHNHHPHPSFCEVASEYHHQGHLYRFNEWYSEHHPYSPVAFHRFLREFLLSLPPANIQMSPSPC